MKLLKQARTALRHLNPDEVRRLAARPIHIGLVAVDGADYAAMEDYLIPGSVPHERRLELLEFVHRAGDPGVPDEVDLVLYHEGIGGSKGTYTYYPDNPAATAHEMLRGNDDIAVPLARQFPAFRQPVVEHLTHSVARENALFAVATALPDVVPSLMELPWVFGEWASDTAFITANQVRMAFLIAAACGRDIGFAEQKLEILSIGGGAFGWRAIARELAGKIPLGGGLVPKGAIAYAGTFVVGKGLELLYRANERIAPGEQRGLYQQAMERGREVVQGLVQ